MKRMNGAQHTRGGVNWTHFLKYASQQKKKKKTFGWDFNNIARLPHLQISTRDKSSFEMAKRV